MELEAAIAAMKLETDNLVLVSSRGLATKFVTSVPSLSMCFISVNPSASRFGGFSPDRLFLSGRRREKKGAGRKPPTSKNRLFLMMGTFIK